MPAANQPKGSVSAGSIKPVTRKAVRCQREVAWLVTQAAGKLVATTDDVNAPTPSFVLAAALSYTREQERAAQDDGHAIDYEAVMGPDLASFCAAQVSLSTALTFDVGGSEIVLQDLFDSIFPGLLPLLATFACVALYKKGVKTIWIILGIFAICIIGTGLGVFAAA